MNNKPMNTTPTNNYQLRDLEIGDAQNLAQVDASAQASAWTAQNFIEEIQAATSGGFGLFAQHEKDPQQALVGYLIYRTVLDEWELLNVVTALTERRQGLGLRMMHELIHRAQQADATRIMLEVRSRNLAAINLYQGLHFRQDGLRKKYYRDDGDSALLMSLIIS